MQQQQVFYCIDLDDKQPEVMEYSGDELKFDLEFFKVKNALELDSYDRRVFDNEADAVAFLQSYNKVLAKLDNKKICKSRELPAMLYKRRYIVQSLMGDKLKTVRHYKKDWQVGQLFNLNDQTFFLTVKLKSIKKLSDNDYEYRFELA